MSKDTTPAGTLEWLRGNPPLDELMERFPDVWEEVGRDLVKVLEDGQAKTLHEFSTRRQNQTQLWLERVRKSRRNPKAVEAALPHLIRGRMALQALEKCYVAAATGDSSGRIRFGFVNGLILQRLLFEKHLTRKPVSLAWFRLWWPLLTQKRYLMPLVQPKGIYCFYSGKLIRELADLIGSRSCLEIAAGDGTLSRFLRDRGVNVRPTDSQAWTHAIQYPAEVEKLGAEEALDKHLPEAVVCSWPPPGNRFERRVFASRRVELYVVIGSKYRFASGDWGAYESQTTFEWAADAALSDGVLPPELDSAVLVFRRRRTRVP